LKFIISTNFDIDNNTMSFACASLSPWLTVPPFGHSTGNNVNAAT